MFADALRMLPHWTTFRPSQKKARLNRQVIQAKDHFPCCHPCAPAPSQLFLQQQVQKHTRQGVPDGAQLSAQAGASLIIETQTGLGGKGHLR